MGQMGCSTFRSALEYTQSVELTSEPQGAEVQTAMGEKLGVTPLKIEGEALKKITVNNKINVVIAAPGYQQREVALELHGKDAHAIQLQPYGPSYFAERMMQEFSKEANAMARGLVEIQSLVFARKLNEAEKYLGEYQNRFPNIAASYVLAASIESLRGNQDKAKRYLLRARTIDPTDPVAARMLTRQAAPIGKAAQSAPLKQAPVRRPAAKTPVKGKR
ncbi:MAG: hypothetical protein A2X94_14165 [Bdellovibrionales bacterium GWB1_55_8]|nr:MAG: hypothetical protein A2X94_14165 [Bdellovibrionales bacterium GWB1_55_8]